MIRILSQILVFALFVVVPVSFSTENIPSLDAPCLKTSALKQTRKATISIVERTVNSRLAVVFMLTEKATVSTPPFTSQAVCFLKMSQGRAPPFFPFV
jgi:hypothetical protein